MHGECKTRALVVAISIKFGHSDVCKHFSDCRLLWCLRAGQRSKAFQPRASTSRPTGVPKEGTEVGGDWGQWTGSSALFTGDNCSPGSTRCARCERGSGGVWTLDFSEAGNWISP